MSLAMTATQLYTVEVWDDDLQKFILTFWTDRAGDWMLGRPVPLEEARQAMALAKKYSPTAQFRFNPNIGE